MKYDMHKYINVTKSYINCSLQFKGKIECELHLFVRRYPWEVNLRFTHAHTDDEGRQK